MTTYNPQNVRIKRRYFSYLKEAEGYSEQTIDAVSGALARYEIYTKHREFRKFHSQTAIAFKKHLTEQRAQRSGEKLSKVTLHSTLNYLKRFFHWLAGQQGFKSVIQYSDCEYFNLSEKDTRIAKAEREKLFPTPEQVRHIIATMPSHTDIERRNRALVAFTFLTGARDGAIASMKLKHVDLGKNCVYQDAREVKTKFSKTFTSYFFPVGDDIRKIVTDWVIYLRDEKLWGNDDPLFPATRIEIGASRQFEAVGLDRKHWSTATPIRTILKDACAAAGLPYFNPHSFRNTLAHLGETICKTPEDFKAWSQNLGHEHVLTTFMSYGAVPGYRQGEIINGLANKEPDEPAVAKEIAEAVARILKGSVKA